VPNLWASLRASFKAAGILEFRNFHAIIGAGSLSELEFKLN